MTNRKTQEGHARSMFRLSAWLLIATMVGCSPATRDRAVPLTQPAVDRSEDSGNISIRQIGGSRIAPLPAGDVFVLTCGRVTIEGRSDLRSFVRVDGEQFEINTASFRLYRSLQTTAMPAPKDPAEQSIRRVLEEMMFLSATVSALPSALQHHADDACAAPGWAELEEMGYALAVDRPVMFTGRCGSQAVAVEFRAGADAARKLAEDFGD